MWYIAEMRWWRAKRLLNDAQDNHAVLRMGDGEDLVLVLLSVSVTIALCPSFPTIIHILRLHT